MNILCISTKKTFELYKQGKVPSHWLYGTIEMEHDGHNIIYEDLPTKFGEDWKKVRKHKPEMIFIPTMNFNYFILLLFLCSINICKIPVYSYIHHSPRKVKGVRGFFIQLLYKQLFKGCKHCFFLSEKTMKDSIIGGYLPSYKCSLPGWGPDMNFYDKVEVANEGYFITTGKENRDFDIIIDAFKETKATLKILTAKSHEGRNYEYLIDKCKDIPNIMVEITENSGEVYPKMLKEMANSCAIVCPLLKDHLKYCVGLSTITDAEGLHKPLIITLNPYHSIERIRHFELVDNLEEWVNAIEKIRDNSYTLSDSEYSMEKAYKEMCKVIFSAL